MKITSFDVKRFRSIRTARFSLRDISVLLGPNNEGKSNILRAMVLGMHSLEAIGGRRRRRQWPMQGRRLGSSSELLSYDWDRDFPLHLRASGPQTTTLEFSFELDDQEIKAFNRTIGSRINGALRVALTFNTRNDVQFKVIKQKAGRALTEKSEDIGRFIGSRISVEYVPSIRTAQEASTVISRLVSEELQSLEEQPAYKEALRTIEKLRTPKLTEIGTNVKDTLGHFLPDVNSVDISLTETGRRLGISQGLEIVVDDGQPTPLEMKGDGVQSLAAIALLRRRAMDEGRSRTFVLAVEEPEAHLHPLAVRALREVLSQIAAEQQVVVTTHSPLLADPLHVDSNIIVQDSAVRPARTIAEVRDCLGVRLADNLQSAQLALVVEGKTDAKILSAVLPVFEGRLEEDLRARHIVIEELGGASSLAHRLRQYATGICDYYVVLDGDNQGKAILDSALSDRLLEPADYRIISRMGKSESEIEDLIDPEVYLEELNARFGTRISARDLTKGKEKWSARMTRLFDKEGKVFSEKTKSEVKGLIADTVRVSPRNALLTDIPIKVIAADLVNRLHGT